MSALTTPSHAELRNRIEQLAISADAKSILIGMADISAKAGDTVIAIGRHVLGFIFDLFRQFPNSSFGLIAGFVIGSLIGAIPFFGAALAAVFTPLLMALGLARGAVADLGNAAIRDRMTDFEHRLRTMVPEAAA